MSVSQQEISVVGMVTLYNSEWTFLEHVGTYINQVNKLYIIDNSENKHIELIEKLISMYPNAQYISNGGNKGIAYALNVGASIAIQDGYDCLLMMDDDSSAPAGLIEGLCKAMKQQDRIGIVAAQSDPNSCSEQEQDVLTIITSGSLLNLDAYKVAGPFLNELFIDWVDHEYCFRLKKYGYRTVVANQIKLKHRLGIFYRGTLFGLLPIKWRSHSPTRLYYKFRNSLYVMWHYRRQLPYSFIIPVLYELLRDVLKITFLEQNKRQYLTLVWKGITDAYKSRLGRLV